METIKVKKSELLEILTANRKKHKAQYKESIRAYRVKAVDLFNIELQKAIAGKQFDIYFDLQKPSCHEKDYNLSIQMLAMSVDETIELTISEFNQLVNDEWNWKSSFQSARTSNAWYNSGTSGYSGSAGTTGISGYSGTTHLSCTNDSGEFTDFEITFSEDEL